MVLIDTSAWIHSLRPDGDPVITARVKELLCTGEAAWCPFVRLELWNGAGGAKEKKILEKMSVVLPELEINQSVWATAYALALQSRTQGWTVPASDLVIFACARHHGVALEHDDEHFQTLASLH